MTIQILMPALSPTMTEGKLAAWIKQEGDPVSPGDLIAEIETDKATMEIESIDEGVMGRILVAAGTEGIAINTPLAILLEEGETAADISDASVSGAAPPHPAAPAPELLASATAIAAPPAATQPAITLPQDDERVLASPLARRMAEQAGIRIGSLTGSGPKGRVVKADVAAAITAASTPVAARSTAAAPAARQTTSDHVAVANSTMRKIIARRLAESKQTAPHFYLTIDCEIDALLATRKQLNARLSKGRISVNDLVIKAAALALREVPAANASWSEEETILYNSVDISVAVAIPGGLITPVVRDAQNKGLAAIAAEMTDLATRARDGKLMPEEYQGGTFSISNLGMYGIREFAAVINPPQGAILAIGAGEQRPVVKDGALAIATVMSCTLSADHRVVDGAVAAEFLAAFKKRIEDPLAMLL